MPRLVVVAAFTAFATALTAFATFASTFTTFTTVISAAAIVPTAIVSATIISAVVASTIVVPTTVVPTTVVSAATTSAAATSAAGLVVAVPFLGARLIGAFLRTAEQAQDPISHALIFRRIVAALLAFLRKGLMALDERTQEHCQMCADDAGDNSPQAHSAPTPHYGPDPARTDAARSAAKPGS